MYQVDKTVSDTTKYVLGWSKEFTQNKS